MCKGEVKDDNGVCEEGKTDCDHVVPTQTIALF